MTGTTRTDPPDPSGLPTLTVAISTRGVRSLALRPEAWEAAPGLDWLLLVQDPAVDPRLPAHLDALAARPDVTVARLASRGLSRSRNAALALARGEVVLLADDDVTHPPGGFAAVRGFFRDRPEASLLVGLSLDGSGRPRRRPIGPVRLTRWNAGRSASHEIAFRTAPVRAAGVRFDESFGVGAGTPAFLGEEFIFIADCLRAGLAGEHRPLPVSIHPDPSTGSGWWGPAAARARAAALGRGFGRQAPLARAAYALKNVRRFGSLGDLLVFLRG
ncbi:MAG TPA: glycosyltransferase family A protein [Amaricoccus sp.]|nr:glycosyltransferase family A protein [Amaricoccus sp.]